MNDEEPRLQQGYAAGGEVMCPNCGHQFLHGGEVEEVPDADEGSEKSEGGPFTDALKKLRPGRAYE